MYDVIDKLCNHNSKGNWNIDLKKDNEKAVDPYKLESNLIIPGKKKSKKIIEPILLPFVAIQEKLRRKDDYYKWHYRYLLQKFNISLPKGLRVRHPLSWRLSRKGKKKEGGNILSVIDKIRQKVNNKKYEFTIPHFFEEMAADYLEFADIKRVIETGRIRQKFTQDPRGTRYEIIGRSVDKREVGVMCRIKSNGKLLFITVYAL